MNDQLTEDEIFLLLGKASGTVRAEEEEVVEKLLRENPHAQDTYNQFVSYQPLPEPRWQQLPFESSVRRFPFRLVAAASVLAVLAIGIVLTRHTPVPPAKMATISPSVELRLADGSVVNLSRQQGSFVSADMQLSNNNKTLEYKATDNSAGKINALSVPAGADYKLKLPDGTEIWLNSTTTLQFPTRFTGNTREVTLYGEAYFNVAKNADCPFVIHLPGSTVRVLGTQFNVNCYDTTASSVALIDGKVKVETGKAGHLLAPGKQAICYNGETIEESTFDQRSVLGWRKGLFYFNNTSLLEISKVLPRWFNITLTTDNPSILHRRFTGVINRNAPIQAFAEDLAAISGIKATIEKNGDIHLSVP